MYQFVILRTQLVGRSNGRKLWVWRVRGGIQSGLLALMGKGRLLATGKGISLLWNKAVLFEELDEIGVSCSPPTKQTRDKPLCWMHIKTFSSEIWLKLWQSVSVTTNNLFRKMGPFRLKNYCFKPSSYTTEEDNAGFICTSKATIPMFYVLVVRKW